MRYYCSVLMAATLFLLIYGCKGSISTTPLVERYGSVSDFTMQSDDGLIRLGIDTANLALIANTNANGSFWFDTICNYTPEMDVYPKSIHSIKADNGTIIYLIIYSLGHLLHWDHVCAYTIGDHELHPARIFSVQDEPDSIIDCMWYDQIIAASNGFPFDDLDDDRFGIYFDSVTQSIYIPILEYQEQGSEFENCLRYTGRFNLLRFDGTRFVPKGTDGAWWLNPDIRNYQRIISNFNTTKGYEQIDLMPDSTLRRTIWKNAKTLDDLYGKPDVMDKNNGRTCRKA